MTEAEHAPPPVPDVRRAGIGWKGVLKAAVSVALLALLLTQTDLARLWGQFRNASPAWLVVALLLYLAMIVASAWRWRELILAQHVDVSTGAPRSLVSRRHVLQQLPAEQHRRRRHPDQGYGPALRLEDGGRQRGPAGSRSGLIGLLLIAAAGETVLNRTSRAALPVGAPLLWMVSLGALAALSVLVAAPQLVHRLLSPLRRVHAEWVEVRLQRLVEMFARFRERPSSLLKCLLGAVVVQAILVAFHAAVASSLRIPIPAAHLAVLVPLSFVVQMIPVSMNGFGVREATFSAYFRMLGLPLESALALSFLATATIMVFSLSGAAAYAARR